MKNTAFIAVLSRPSGHRGTPELAFLNTFRDTGDEIVYFRHQAEHFTSYSAAMDAILMVNTKGWASSEIEEI
jgi:hypothetical protein